MPKVYRSQAVIVSRLDPYYLSSPIHLVGFEFCRRTAKAPRQLRYVLIAIVYFSKWVEVEPMEHPTVDE